MIKKEELKQKLEPFIYEKLQKDTYEVIKLNPIELLTWNKLDLAFKLFYLDNKVKNEVLATKIYKEDIKAQTLSSFREYGNEDKDSFDKYIEAFNVTYKNIKEKGFNENETLIPLSNVNTIMNGSHRIASAIHLNKEISCVRLEQSVVDCDYKYFYGCDVSNDILDMVASKFIEYSENTYIAFLWPSGNEKKELAESKFSNIIYKKEIELSSNGGFNLLYELYKHMDWVGNKENNYSGVIQKLIECFPNFNPFTVVVFQSESLEKVREIKEEVRKIYNIGFSSVHITDTKEEAVRISQLVLNENGLHFLKYANPFKIKSLEKQLETYQNFLEDNNIDNTDIILDSSILLSLYGLREAGDVDYLLDDKYFITNPYDDIESHDEILKFYKDEKINLIYNPKYFFYYKGFKFISFNSLYSMKKNRDEEKDRNDIKIMESLIENNLLKQKINQIKQKLFYFRIKFKRYLFESVTSILKQIGLYESIRFLYRKLRGRK